MVSVDNHIVARQLHITILLHIRTAIVAVFLVKAVLQIEVRIIRRVHYRVVDIGIFYANPAR